MNDLSVIEAEFGDLSRWQQCPDFWVAKPDMGLPFLETLREVSTRVIGTSAGGREILALEYGAFESLDATNDNLHSSIASKIVPPDPTEIFPKSFYGSTRRTKPVLAIQGGIHGGELVGTVASLNLCRIIEEGVDLRGKAWPKLQELACQTRILIIPWLNIDGVERWPLAGGTDGPSELYARCTQGVAKDGTKYSYPEVKAISPIPPESTAFMGSYYNDAGINLQYDFCVPHRQPETVAWMEYYLAEKPDGILIWHCDSGSMMGAPGYYLPTGHRHEYSRLGGAVRNRLLREGHKIHRTSWATLPNMGKPYVTQMDATYLTCGGLPIMCELPAGTDFKPFSFDELLDIGLLTIEETLFYAHTDGLRPYEFWEKVKNNLR
jgi:hypothetical protein